MESLPGVFLRSATAWSATAGFFLAFWAVVELPDCLANGFAGRLFVTRNKTVGDLFRAIHGAYLDDETLTIEHAYTAEKNPLEAEQLTIQEQKFDPANGRLFLVDLSTDEPRIVQQKIELPAGIALEPLDDEHILELADNTLDELAKKNKDVEAFVSGKKPGK